MKTDNKSLNKPAKKNLQFCSSKGECQSLLSSESILCRGEMLSSLFNISKVVIESEDLTETLSLLLKIMKDDMGVIRGIVNLFNGKTGKIFIHDSIGLTEEEETRGVYSIGEGITGKVVGTGESIIVPRICDEPAFLDRTKSHSRPEDNNLAFVCIPILRGKKSLGAISVERVCDNPNLLKYDVELLGIIATMIAQAVELYLLENEERYFWKTENERLRKALKKKFHPPNIIGNSTPMLEVYSLINKISETRTTVLLLGESGVGKELVANAIHYNSMKASGPFIKFNCAALPESLIESELFGHEKGSFTGAGSTRKGRFEEADGGTIFLDEVGELSLPMQAKLLRILQERTFERVGGNKPIHVDIRIIAATNRNLISMVQEGCFREDLYYRLCVVPIMIPPLRDRNSDIIFLAEHFVAKFSKQFEKEIKRISAPVQNIFLSYSWPGNVRELENIIERAVIFSEDNVIHEYDLPLSLQAPVSVIPAHDTTKSNFFVKLDSFEYEIIAESLLKHKGNMTAAAKELGLTRRMFGSRMKKLGINYKKFRTAKNYFR